jgi:hypothetical protein
VAATVGGIAASIAMLVTVMIATGGQHAVAPRPLAAPAAAPVAAGSADIPLAHVPRIVGRPRPAYRVRLIARSKPSPAPGAEQPLTGPAVGRQQLSAPAPSPTPSSSWPASWSLPSQLGNWSTYASHGDLPWWAQRGYSR